MDCAGCAAALPDGARFCPSCGTPAAPATGAAAEERKLVTVVFCDLVGSTPLSERLDPETLRSVTLRYFAAMRAPIERFGGTVEKFIGDAVMAVFGVPVMHEDDARRAAAAALGMIDALAELNRQLESSLGVVLQVRIGVNTGPAVTGTGVADRQALVSGETVNVAARLEQNAGAGNILIGPVTLAAIGPAVQAEPVGPLRLKGKEEPVLAHRLLGVGRDDPELGRRFDLPLIGRTRQLAELDAALARCAADGSRLLTVHGEPGIGKTRLVRDWLEHTAGSAAVGHGRCRPYGEHGSLTPLAEALRGLLDGPAGSLVRDTEARAVLDAGLLRDGSPGPSAEATCRALARVLAEAGGGGLSVLVLDDCQWAGEQLLDVLERLVQTADTTPLLVVCTTRNDLAERPAPGPRHGALTVPPLSFAECEQLGAALADVSAHADGALAAVVERSGGNPLFVEQLMAAALDGAPLDLLPHSLQALLGARIDALAPAERTALDLAAVIGREFTAEDLAALAASGPENDGPLRPDPHAPDPGRGPVPEALRKLTRRRMIEPADAGAGAAALRFSSALVHEATYQAMAKRARADRHERTAGLLAARPGTDPVVAGHLERAYRCRAELGLRDGSTDALRRRAADLLTASGAKALTRSDLAWAGALLERAANLAEPGDAGWAGTLRRLGEVRLATGRTGDGRTLLQTVLDAADPGHLDAAHARLALAVVDPREPVAAAARVARAVLPRFEEAGDELGIARGHVRIAQEQQLLGSHGRAAELLDTAQRRAADCDAEPELALALGALGVSLWRGPVPVPRALEHCRALLERHAGPRLGVRFTLSCPTAVLLALDDRPDEARDLLGQARRAAERLGYAEAAVVLPLFAAVVESWTGRADLALDALAEAEAAVRAAGADGMLPLITREQARILLPDAPAEAAARLRALPGEPEALLRADAADLYGLRARVAAAHGDPDEALRLVDRAVVEAEHTDSPEMQAVAQLDRADVLDRLGLPQQAAAAAETALRRLQNKGHLPGTRRAAALRAQLPDPARGPDRGGEERG